MKKRKHVRRSAAFRADALAYLRTSDLSLKEVSQNLGIPESTLYNWYRGSMSGPKSTTTSNSGVLPSELSEAQKEIRRLRKKLARVEMEREILKKATAFFAKESE